MFGVGASGDVLKGVSSARLLQPCRSCLLEHLLLLLVVARQSAGEGTHEVASMVGESIHHMLAHFLCRLLLALHLSCKRPIITTSFIHHPLQHKEQLHGTC